MLSLLSMPLSRRMSRGMDTLNGRLPTMVSGGNDRSSQCGTSSVGKSSGSNVFTEIGQSLATWSREACFCLAQCAETNFTESCKKTRAILRSAITFPPCSGVMSNHNYIDKRIPLTGDVVVEDVSQVDLEGAPRRRLEEAQRRQKARVLLDDVHLLRPARQKGSCDPTRPGTHFHHDLRFGNKLS